LSRLGKKQRTVCKFVDGHPAPYFSIPNCPSKPGGRRGR
jgi:hypothetical protein